VSKTVKYRLYVTLWGEKGYSGTVEAESEEGLKIKYVTQNFFEDQDKAKGAAMTGFRKAVAALAPGAKIEEKEK
jgi:hypothetical protein